MLHAKWFLRLDKQLSSKQSNFMQDNLKQEQLSNEL